MTSLKFYKAQLKTAGKRINDLKQTEGFEFFDDDELQNFIKAYEIIDGKEITVIESLLDSGSYTLVGWYEKDDESFKEFTYLMEQDSLFGQYENMREEFDRDWDADEYEPVGSLSFPADVIEILEKVPPIK